VAKSVIVSTTMLPKTMSFDVWSAAAGPGFTYPAADPVRRIDYVFTRGPLMPHTARVLATDASDHRPVIAVLVLPPR